MAKQLTHEQAAKRDQYCVSCGLINYEKKPRVYTCPRCDKEGYECCFPAGSNTVCLECEEGDGNDHQTTIHY